MLFLIYGVVRARPQARDKVARGVNRGKRVNKPSPAGKVARSDGGGEPATQNDRVTALSSLFVCNTEKVIYTYIINVTNQFHLAKDYFPNSLQIKMT